MKCIASMAPSVYTQWHHHVLIRIQSVFRRLLWQLSIVDWLQPGCCLRSHSTPYCCLAKQWQSGTLSIRLILQLTAHVTYFERCEACEIVHYTNLVSTISLTTQPWHMDTTQASCQYHINHSTMTHGHYKAFCQHHINHSTMTPGHYTSLLSIPY